MYDAQRKSQFVHSRYRIGVIERVINFLKFARVVRDSLGSICQIDICPDRTAESISAKANIGLQDASVIYVLPAPNILAGVVYRDI